MKLTATLLLALVILTGCREEERASPDATYRDYYAKVIAGRSFEEDAEHQAKARRDEVMAQIEAQSGSGRTADETRALYLDFTRALAACGTLTLREERVEGDVASLVYDVENTCDGDDGELLIGMVWEDGWKIQSDELKVRVD